MVIMLQLSTRTDFCAYSAYMQKRPLKSGRLKNSLDVRWRALLFCNQCHFYDFIWTAWWLTNGNFINEFHTRSNLTEHSVLTF